MACAPGENCPSMFRVIFDVALIGNSTMKLKGKVVIVTGGAMGIGRALCQRFAAEGAKAVVVADLEADGAAQVANEIGGMAVTTNVAVEADIISLVAKATEAYGGIDLFCSNAGIG